MKGYQARHIRVTAVVALLALLLFFGVRSFGATLSFAQLAAFPFVLWIVARLLKFAHIPRGLFLAALCIGTFGVATMATFDSGGSDSIVVARLEGDDVEIYSRRLREGLNSFVASHAPVHFRRHPTTINDRTNAMQYLAKVGGLALIAGTTQWLHIYFPPPPIRKISEFIPPRGWIAGEGFGDAVLIDGPPEFFVSRLPENATTRFLGLFFLGVDFSNEIDEERRDAQRLLYLVEAQQVRALWRSDAHRAVARFLMGNIFLKEALRSDLDLKPLACALQSYQGAFKSLQGAEGNLELLSAIHNNYALATILERLALGKIKAVRFRARSFEYAFSKGYSRDRNDPLAQRVAWQAAFHNLTLLADLDLYETHWFNPGSRKFKQIERKRNRNSTLRRRNSFANKKISHSGHRNDKKQVDIAKKKRLGLKKRGVKKGK
jgi:hypothetical protein